MFDIDRVYGQRNNQTGLIEWFFTAREGVFGPFSSQEIATLALEKFKEFNVENCNDGGRDLNIRSKLSLLPFDNYLYQARHR